MVDQIKKKSDLDMILSLQERVTCLEEVLSEVLDFLEVSTDSGPMEDWLLKLKVSLNEW